MKSDQPVLISACLLGENCRYDGKHSIQSGLLDMLKDKQIIPVCPEVEGGLLVPRPPAEIRGNKVLRENGEDLSVQFANGSQTCLNKGLAENSQLAILKSRSPACGCGQIYDGSFSGKLTPGDGIFTQTLKAAGFTCISDEEFVDGGKHS